MMGYTMSNDLRNQVHNDLNTKETDELLEIWKTNDHVEWSDLTFDVLEDILTKRIGELPSQNDPIFDYDDEDQDDGLLEEWEDKLLDDENQPELYDTLDVLSLKDNINTVAKAVVVVKIFFGILSVQFVQSMFMGVFPTIEDISGILWNLLIRTLAVGIDIAIIYFPLKALVLILRILMEMEFNSRKASNSKTTL